MAKEITYTKLLKSIDKSLKYLFIVNTMIAAKLDACPEDWEVEEFKEELQEILANW